jgi:putative endonuclease
MSIEIGKLGEQQACQYLTQQGLILVCRNYRCRLGEIDLIMQEVESLVFVEVRTRSSSVYGGALESVTTAKKRKLIRAASLYLQEQKLFDKVATRFDVLSIEGPLPTITWVKDAFGTDF